ncbi:aspartyl/asparaginyl beta-hydroxylase family protein (macronuclear) [Tetrahymena thermophila SB210]|uniref:Aspartyl/asparaginyl beta-hydroxylase family protein n=1 Tax=Tetrahymena thermophila (strain SB210) TaxID=312017 RepID=Q22AG0_TETTS|nr:aspartyl/asparaginyl beta-hydroxylase family protein [Tetrahymena thermophila SB210]EAR82282.2 aspartyl/asparaginyl beta-hydroxylase family protein [Tetrahymena thermophila SB210]|eukprot:XP_001029945.2 aspartyl/asparaginyl beta-hydroxylase family protein [Tetrahymena thermophila SB210]
MKRKAEDQEITLGLLNFNQIKQPVGNLFCKTNIYSLKYLVDQFSSNPSLLRQKLLKYTNLHQPYFFDIQIETDFMNEDEIQQDVGESLTINLQQKLSTTTGKKSVSINFDNIVKDISDEEYANVMLKMLEVLGVTIETRIRNYLNESSPLPKELYLEIKNMLALKTKHFFIMNSKSCHEFFEEKELEEYFKQRQVFMSYYDKIIEEIYTIYLQKLFNPKSKEQIQSSIEEIVSIIDQALNSQLLSELKINEDTKQLRFFDYLTFKEQNNLTQLREMFLQSQEYFCEPLKQLSERQFFFFREQVKFNEDEEKDKFCFFSFSNGHIFKYTDLIKNSICSLANCRGGIMFFGIHNLSHKIVPISLKELYDQNVIGYLNKIFLEVHPKPSHQIKLLSVVNQFKCAYREVCKSDYIITITINPRKAQEIFYVYKNQEKQYNIRNTNLNQKLKSEQVSKLKEMRASETDEPNLYDYLEFNDTFCPQEYRQHLQLLVKHYDISPIKKTVEFEAKKRYSDDCQLAEKKQFYDNERLAKSNEHSNRYNQNSEFILKRTNNFAKSYQQQQKNNQEGCLSIFDKKNNSVDENYPQVQNFADQNNKQLSKLKQKNKEQFLQNHLFGQLSAWRFQILKQFLDSETNVSFQDFLNTSIMKKYVSLFSQLNSKNTFIVYKIDGQHRISFKDAVVKTFRENNIDMEYIGNLYNFTILKIDKEKSWYKIENLITPITILFSFKNKAQQGFNYDHFEIKNTYDPLEAKEILKTLYDYLGVEHTVNYVNHKLYVCFPKMQNFIFGFTVFLQIKKMLEYDESTNKVYTSFNYFSKV